MTVLTQFFCKMYFLYVSRGRKKNGQYFRGFYPPQKAFFFPTPRSSLSFTKIVATLQKLRLLSNSRVAYDHRTQLKSFTKIAEHFIYTPLWEVTTTLRPVHYASCITSVALHQLHYEIYLALPDSASCSNYKFGHRLTPL